MVRYQHTWPCFLYLLPRNWYYEWSFINNLVCFLLNCLYGHYGKVRLYSVKTGVILEHFRYKNVLEYQFIPVLRQAPVILTFPARGSHFSYVKCSKILWRFGSGVIRWYLRGSLAAIYVRDWTQNAPYSSSQLTPKKELKCTQFLFTKNRPLTHMREKSNFIERMCPKITVTLLFLGNQAYSLQ